MFLFSEKAKKVRGREIILQVITQIEMHIFVADCNDGSGDEQDTGNLPCAVPK